MSYKGFPTKIDYDFTVRYGYYPEDYYKNLLKKGVPAKDAYQVIEDLFYIIYYAEHYNYGFYNIENENIPFN